MKTFYFYLAGIALLASGAEMASKLSGDKPVSQEWVAKPETKSDKKSQEKVPFARARKKAGAKAFLAPSITATNSDAVISGGATAGGVLEYTVVIANGGPDPANGTTFTETIDINTTLVAGSVVASPIAVNDSYSTIGNVGINIDAGSGLFANDVSPGGTALSLSGSTTITSTGGGTATVTAATGAFTYEPAAGYTGTDTFTYDIQNGSGMTSQATVSITVSNMIWFINDDAAAGGTGTLAKPFNSLNGFQAINNGTGNNAKDGHFIFIYSGNYDGGINVRNNQTVFGQGAGTAGSTLLTLTGLSAPSGSNLLPAVNGTRPALTNSSGNVFSLLGAATVQGLNIGNSSGAKFQSTASGTFTASQIDLTGTGPALNISNKALAATFGQVSSTVSSGTVSPIKLSSVSGNLTITSGTLTANNSTNIPALDISGGITLAVTLTAVNANGGNKGMIISGTSGSFQVTGSGTTLGSGGTIQNIAQRGIELLNTTNITLKNINLTNANTTDGTTPSGTPTDMANGNANAAVHALNTNGLTMDRIIISGTVAQEGINLRGTSNFNFTNGAVGSSGTAGNSFEGCLFAVNTGGTNTITNSTFTDPGGRAAYFANFSTNMTLLTVDNSTFQDADGATGLQVFGYGTSNVKVKVQNNSKFLNCRAAGFEAQANDNSLMTVEIKNSTVDPGSGVGRGIDVSALNNSTAKFNIESNNVKHNSGIGINSFGSGNATIEGTILNNTTDNPLLSNSVSGIVATVEGITAGSNTAKATVLIQGNTVKNVQNVHGISTGATVTGGSTSNFSLVNNNVQLVSAIAYYGIDVNAAALDPLVALNNAIICSKVSGNTINMSSPTNFAYRARAGNTSSTFRSEGTGSSIVNVWDNGGNTPTGRAIQSGAGTFTFNQTCAQPGALTFREGVVEVLGEKEEADKASTQTALAEPVAAPAAEPEVAIATPAAQPVTEPVVSKATETAAPSPARTEAVQAGETVTVNGTGSGFTIPSGKSTTIKFRVTINNNIPASVCLLSTQGTVSGSNFANVLTDDPATGGSNEPTTTTVTSTPVITFCPGNQTFSPDAGTCTSTQTFTATADGCPAPTITYTVGGNPITFPYAFPAGNTTVLVTASNGIGTAPTCSFTVTVTPTPAPPVTDQPDAQTICAGSGTTFTVATSQAGATYQWQKKPFGGSFANISTVSNPTAHDATLTLANLQVADNLAEYRCIISNPCNNSTSNAAVLTVNQITGSSIAGTTAVNQGAPAPNVTFSATGGTLPYTFTYKINNGTNQTVSTTGVQTSATVSQSTAAVGTFTYELVTVTDAQNCTLTPPSAQTATVTVSNNLTATISGSTTACQNEVSSKITFTAVNGIAPFTFTYKINGGGDLTVSTTGVNTTATVDVPTSSTGSFVYSLTNVAGAGGATTPISGQTATVNVNAKPTIALSGAEYQCQFAATPQTYTVFFTATAGAVITTDKGTVSGNTVINVPSKETATIVATLNGCSDTLTAYKDCSLPVTLIDFSGAKVENTIALRWNTAEETHSDRFDIQRSADGKNWATIGTQKSQGESYSAVNYTFVDKKPASGDNFYRLKMIDTDKTFAYSKIIKVGYDLPALNSESYPNPVSDVLNLRSTDWSQVKAVEMHSLTGLLVYKSGKTVSKTIDVKSLPVGMYILTITHKNGEVVNRKVLINR
ncbi:Ig-like domain-containing protein [Dyadobacter jiangsuensis]|uniref:Putative secreted protein (Por secretion system target) n=1 Tax=Dyadobacter jiangsuensis TaxID=1591085 RepID=A0A2P8FN27_9BACT|nr:T9SS type A sorting domain-containing protein [Dyadobacter jiangsuensis]PSL23134.1 putative secreted protein (Por secretion system target) [Dyadobacter jiangsuensis]